MNGSACVAPRHEYMESDLEAADGAQLPDLVSDSVVISEIIYAPPLN